jgi:hypothetical protein
MASCRSRLAAMPTRNSAKIALIAAWLCAGLAASSSVSAGGRSGGRQRPRPAGCLLRSIKLFHPHAAGFAHPDAPSLLALRGSLCAQTGAPCLPSWTAAADPCTQFEGVFCGGGGRVASVHVQLRRRAVAFSEPASAAPLEHCTELVIACTGGHCGSRVCRWPRGCRFVFHVCVMLPSATPATVAGEGSPPTGSLPQGWSLLLPRLEHARVASCNASGPLPHLAAFPALRSLALPSNQLAGRLPEEVRGAGCTPPASTACRRLPGLWPPPAAAHHAAPAARARTPPPFLCGSCPRCWPCWTWRTTS